MSGAPPDWYPDPYQPSRLRYWDGFQWTEHVHQGYADLYDRPGRYRSVGDWLSRTFEDLGKAWQPLAIIGLVTMILPGIVVWLVTLWAIDDLRIVNDEVFGFSLGRVLVAGGASVAAALVLAYGSSAMAAVLSGTRRGRVLAAGEGLALAWRTFARVIGIGLALIAIVAALFVVAVLLAVAGLAGLTVVLLLLAVPTAIFVGVRLALLPLAIVSTPAGSSSIRTAWEATRGRFWGTFGRTLLLGLIVGIGVGLIFSIIGSIAGTAGTTGDGIVLGDEGDDIAIVEWNVRESLGLGGGRAVAWSIITSLQHTIRSVCT